MPHPPIVFSPREERLPPASFNRPDKSRQTGLEMPSPKRRVAPAKQSICPDTIDRRRAAYVAEIDRIRALQSGSNDILEKADSLLTAHWAHASWTSRAAILRSVDWLLRIAIHHRAPARGLRTTMAAPYAARP